MNSPRTATALIAVVAITSIYLIQDVGAFVPKGHSRKSYFGRLFGAADGRRSDGMPILPDNVKKYSTVPNKAKYFTADKTPKGLLNKHTTKEGTWGLIRVFTGKLDMEYSIFEPQESVHVLDPTSVGVIEPTMLHQVKPLSDDLEFVVEFWRVPGTGDVDEKREGL